MVFAICIKDSNASCMRAPPEAEMLINAELVSIAWRTPRTKRSPTTEPIEPPMKSNSNTAMTTGCSRIVPACTTKASVSPVFLTASIKRSEYLRLSLNFKLSTGLTSCANSTRLSASNSCSIRARALTRRWWSHLGQTY